MSSPVKPWPRNVPHHLQVQACNLYENLARSAEADPQAPALIFHGAVLTYGELQRQVLELAGWMEQVAGVAKGDRVLLYMQNSPQFVIGYYAILRANAVVVPVNAMNRQKELSHLVDDTGARVALAGQELLDCAVTQLGPQGLHHILVAAYADMADPSDDIPLPSGLTAPGRDDYGIPGVHSWAGMRAAGLRPGPITAGPDDLAVIPYTSGTTGRQKGCMHTHRTVMIAAVSGIEWYGPSSGESTLAVLPLFHVTGMQNSMNGPIYKGYPIIIMARWDRRVAARLIRRHAVARWRCISAMIIDLLEDPELCVSDLASLRSIGGGGASMPAPVARRLKEITGLDYVEGYGMSETMAGVLINPVDAPQCQCLGVPTFDVDARIIDPDSGRELGTDEAGEIIINAPQVFLGYWNDPAATEAAFTIRDGKRFLRTGDIAMRDAAGYYRIVDRVKRMVNASGFKVWPTEVEALMHDHPDIADVCIVGYPDPRRGENVLAYVVSRRELSETEVIDWCRLQMAAYKVPRHVVFLPQLPRSGSGKVEWLQLQEKAARDFGAAPPLP